jgi:hypothetical protein
LLEEIRHTVLRELSISRQTFGLYGVQKFKGSYAENFDFDEMDVAQFTNGHTFAVAPIEFRTAPEEQGGLLGNPLN